MTLRLFAPNPLVVGEPGNILVYSDNPGVVSLTYGAGLTGPASVTIPGTRVWRNGLRPGQYLARANCGQARVNRSWCFEIDYSTIIKYVGATSAVHVPVVMSFNSATARRINWEFAYYCAQVTASSWYLQLQFGYSPTSITNDFLISRPAEAATAPSGRDYLLVTYDGTNVRMYWTTGTTANHTIAVTISGTMGGTEFLAIMLPCKISGYDRILSQADREGWCQSGTLPVTPDFSYQGGHEIDPSAPVFWDLSANNYDLSAVNIGSPWPPAAASGDYTDTVPVVPYAIVPVTAVATTGTTIDATRPRQGVPSRAAYLEKTEVADQITVTVNEAPSSEQDVAMLHIYADRDGLATITCDVPGILDFPATLYVNEGTNVVSGDIVGAGVVNVTVELNGSTSVTPFTIDAIPLNLNIGPETTLDYEGLPITFKMIASCDHFDKTVNLSTTGVGITVPPTIYLNGAPVEFEVTVDGFGEYSVTGEVDGETSTADIHSINDAIKLYLEADRDIFTEDLPITFNMRVYCSRDGLVTLSSTGAGVVIPDTVNVVLGVAEFPVTIGSTGLKIISAVYDVAYAECAIDVDSEAVVISLGEDRHVYYSGNDIVVTKTVYCNKEGSINLTQSGTPVDMPATVTIVGGVAEFDITVSSGGDTMIEAEKDGVTTECRIISTAVPVESSIGPDQELFIRYQETLIPKLMVSTDRPIVVPITSTAGFPASVTVDGSEEITGSITTDGTYDVTTPYDSATIIVTKEPNVVRIGPNSENEPTLHVSTNWPGVVTLTVVPDYGYTLPATVTVGTTLEADIEGTFVVHGTYVVTATFGAATDTCTAVYSNEDSEGCYIYGTLTDASGRPVRNATLTFKPVPTAQTIGSTILARTTKTARTDRLGAFEIRVLRGSQLIVTCDILQYRKQITVPDQERVDLEDL
jgi:hypothetical protein